MTETTGTGTGGVPRPPQRRPAPRVSPVPSLRTLDDEVRLVRRRQHARAFTVAAGGTDPYPDPRFAYARAIPYALTVPELHAEWVRLLRAGWSAWELDARLRPSPIAAAS